MNNILMRCILPLSCRIIPALIVWVTALFWLTSVCRANGFDFAELSLEELKNVEIISVSKKPEKISEAPAAVFVITAEDIRRSGATNIPEILRLAPGMEVARIGTNSWAVSARGFNEFYADKLLVMIDGRSVYTPIFSGVFWDVQDTLIADIDRIEVIRGPGSILWGANAVNGVINIITKKARDTQGGLFTAGAGDREPGFGSIRYGGNSGKDACYRIYAKYFYREPFDAPDENKTGKHYLGTPAEDMSTDNWQSFRGGFRFDWDPEPSNALSFQGEAYLNGDDMMSEVWKNSQGSELLNESSEVAGGHLLGSWQHIFSDTSDTVLQFYYDRTKRDSLQAKYSINIFDADFQHRFVFASKHEITYGLGYRFISDEIEDFYLTSFNPNSRDQYLFSAFVQDEIQLIPDILRLTLGSKFEHNDFSGFEIQPGIRLLWMPHKSHSLWAAVSRAVRSPARSDHDISKITGLESSPGSVAGKSFSVKIGGAEEIPEKTKDIAFDTVNTESGSDSFDSEFVIACEIGYRVQPADGLWIDTALFYNRYRGLESMEEIPAGDVIAGGKLEFENSIIVSNGSVNSFQPGNKMEGTTYGIELAADWQAAEWCRLRAAYSYLTMDMSLSQDSTDTQSKAEIEGSSPEHQFSLWSSLDITKQLEFDVRLRYISDLPARNTDGYTAMDTRLAWKHSENLEFSIAGQDIADSPHSEFSGLEVERSFYGKMEWKF